MLVPARPVVYPESDGLPMGETETHVEALWDLVQVIRGWLDDPDHTHVCGNQFFYFTEGDPTDVFCPDVYVIRGVAQQPQRRIWKLWEEPDAVPSLIVELSSPSSFVRDLGPKRGLYEVLGVEEYAVFDVLAASAPPRLRLWRRVDGAYVEQTGPEPYSSVLGARLRPDDWRLRLVGPGGPVPSPEERARLQAGRAEREAERAARQAARATAAEVRAAREAERATAAEARLAEALAELRRLKGDTDER